MVCLALEARFSEIMPLAVHPKAKYGLALQLRTLCRRALRLGSALHFRLCCQLRSHRQEEVRAHIVRLVLRKEAHNIWRAGRRRAAEETDAGDCGEQGSESPRDGHNFIFCRCDPLREIVEGVMRPRLSATLSQEGMRRWLLRARNTVHICRCGNRYKHLWCEALRLGHRQR